MIFFYLLILSFQPSFTKAKEGILDILQNEKQHAGFSLDKHLKKDVSFLLPTSRKEYRKLSVAFENKKYDEALKLWSPSFQKSRFAKGSTGQALYAFLIFKNGFKVLGLEHLFQTVDPNQVHLIVHNLWKREINSKDPVWNHFIISWKKEWTSFFNEKRAFQMGSKKEISPIRDRKYLEYLLGLSLDNKKLNTFHLKWFLAVHLIQAGNMNTATQVLIWLLKNVDDQDKKNTIHLTIGRLLNDIGETKAALHYYDQVQGLSFKWLLAKEEKSWIHYKKGEYAKAFSEASAFTYIPLQNILTPSMFLIRSLSQLKNCDYSNLARSLQAFKQRFENQRIQLKKRDYESIQKDLIKVYSLDDKLLNVQHLSFFMKTDLQLKNLILLKNFMEINSLKSQNRIKTLESKNNQILRRLDRKIKNKLNSFFQKELVKIDWALKWMHLVEVEALYRIHGYHKNPKIGMNVHRPKFKSSRKSIRLVTFPFNGKEVWGDEIAGYQTSFSHICPRGSYVL